MKELDILEELEASALEKSEWVGILKTGGSVAAISPNFPVAPENLRNIRI